MIVPEGFLKTTTDIILRRFKTRINPKFAFAISEVLLSLCCWNVKFTNGFASGQPNIWIRVILPSGDVKSFPINKIMRPVMKFVEINLQYEENEPIKKLWISSYTPESIIKFMNPMWDDVITFEDPKPVKVLRIGNVGIIVKDEESMALKAINDKKYMSGILETDSLIYDGGDSRTVYHNAWATRGYLLLQGKPFCRYTVYLQTIHGRYDSPRRTELV